MSLKRFRRQVGDAYANTSGNNSDGDGSAESWNNGRDVEARNLLSCHFETLGDRGLGQSLHFSRGRRLDLAHNLRQRLLTEDGFERRFNLPENGISICQSLSNRVEDSWAREEVA